MAPQLVGFLGIIALLLLTYALSSNRKAIAWKTVLRRARNAPRDRIPMDVTSAIQRRACWPTSSGRWATTASAVRGTTAPRK